LSKVRLRLSGALMFAANLVGYLTGFLFTIFITRRLSEEEFGVWALIGSFITYSLMPFNLVSSWISRDAARGKKILSSAATLFLLLTPISIMIYFSMALGSAAAIKYDLGVMAFGIIVLIPYILLSLGTAIQLGYAPQNLGIARILFEVSKVAVAFYLVVILRLGLIGAFISLSIAYLLQASILLQKSKQLFQKQVSRGLIAKWLKGAPVNTIQMVNNVLATTDIILIGIITGQAVLVGYWQAAIAASALVVSSSALMRGLSPRLISGGSQRDLDKAFDFTTMLMIPMLFGFLVLSRDILWILRPTYSSVWIASCLLALAGVIRTIGNFGSVAILGTDRFDQKDDVPLKEFFASKIFILNKVSLILTSLYVVSVAIYLFIVKNLVLDISGLITSIAAMSLVFRIVDALVKLRLMRRLTELRLTFRGVRNYIIASAIMTVIIYILRIRIGSLPVKAIEAAVPILMLIIVGAIIYASTLYLISQEFRSFLKDIRVFLATKTAPR